MESIAFIESNTTGTGELFIMQALEQGLNVYFLSRDPFRYNFISKNNINFVKVNTDDKRELKNILQVMPNLRGIFSSSEYYIDIVNQLNEDLGFISNNTEAIKLCRDKYSLSSFLSNYDLAPKTYQLKKTKITRDFFQNNSTFVLKPIMGSGSVNVLMIRSYGEYLEKTSNLKMMDFILQEYIDGEEYSIEVVTVNNQHKILGITKKHIGDEPFFVEIGHDFPATTNLNLENKITLTVNKVLNLINYKNGPSHIEIKVNHEEDIKIIEINPRLAGGMIPIMIGRCTNIDLIKTILDLSINKTNEVEKTLNNYRILYRGAIRFKLASKSGIIEDINLGEANGNKNFSIIQLKEVGDNIELKGDFNDRLVCIITKNEQGLDEIDQITKDIKINICDTDTGEIGANILNNTGRIKSLLHPFIKKILSVEFDLASKEIQSLISIDETHIIMLSKQGVICKEKAGILLKEIQSLKENNYEAIRDLPKPRGLYLSYENLLINKLGEDIAGNLQLGRSRNDINATTNSLICRDLGLNLISVLNRFNSSLVLNSLIHKDLNFPIYSQYQTALAGSFGHYLMAIFESLHHETLNLIHVLKKVSSPLGAAAGGGTIVPTNQNITSVLLGFRNIYINSINAISNRDLNIDLNNITCNIAVKLSRCIQDLQVWSTREFDLIDFPDYLSGGSSAMPQKKNPYLLELLKSKIGYILTNKDHTYNAIFKTPLSNSFEVTNSSLKNSIDLMVDVIKVIEILSFIFNNLIINKYRSEEIIKINYTYLNEISEKLYLDEGIPFRSSHHFLGSLVGKGLNFTDVLESVNLRYGTAYTARNLKEELIKDFGMGPGERSMLNQINFSMNSILDVWKAQKDIRNKLQESVDIRNSYIKEIVTK
ncbi:argininosuccinate lyase [Evansella caseinilytica]|uniref:argininosuccinate lyase n=1 Tax=Evansella caseinilytica TaxID=1503961 RepID=A0A1H3LBN8_9BACI|nr:lyase family protein [Evansella caseinilytica]SDY61275.1 argininosuccinate lyase [Evansella caseinilytica]